MERSLCAAGIVVGVIFTIQGIKCGFYEPYLESLKFGGDYYTESYNAAYRTYYGIISAVHVLGDLLAAFGIFQICFFGIKLKEISVQSNEHLPVVTRN